jgi:hypothetical protein
MSDKLSDNKFNIRINGKLKQELKFDATISIAMGKSIAFFKINHNLVLRNLPHLPIPMVISAPRR